MQGVKRRGLGSTQWRDQDKRQWAQVNMEYKRQEYIYMILNKCLDVEGKKCISLITQRMPAWTAPRMQQSKDKMITSCSSSAAVKMKQLQSSSKQPHKAPSKSRGEPQWAPQQLEMGCDKEVDAAVCHQTCRLLSSSKISPLTFFAKLYDQIQVFYKGWWNKTSSSFSWSLCWSKALPGVHSYPSAW